MVRVFFQAEDGIRDIGVTGVQTCALPISDGKEVGEGLAGVVGVGEAVYDGDLGGLGELLDLLVVEGPDHDGVYVAGEDAPGVRRGLPLADLYLLRQQVEGVAAELVHADLEGDAGAVRGLLEDHSQRPAAQGPEGDARPLEPLCLGGFVEDEARLIRGELGQCEAVAAGEGGWGRRGAFELGDHALSAISGSLWAHVTAETAPRKKSRAKRISVRLTVRGGARRMVLPPMRLTSSPFSRQCSKTRGATS